MIRGEIKEMLERLYDGQLELCRLNYGVIILLPKVKPVNSVKQFRPICLLKVIYKIVTKTLTIRLSIVVGSVVSKFQTTFISWKKYFRGSGDPAGGDA